VAFYLKVPKQGFLTLRVDKDLLGARSFAKSADGQLSLRKYTISVCFQPLDMNRPTTMLGLGEGFLRMKSSGDWALHPELEPDEGTAAAGGGNGGGNGGGPTEEIERIEEWPCRPTEGNWSVVTLSVDCDANTGVVYINGHCT
jgi:hypothetical protein